MLLPSRPACAQQPPHDLQGGLAKAFEPAFAWMATRYQAAVGKELVKYGLRYEDLYDPQQDLVRRRREPRSFGGMDQQLGPAAV